MGQYIKMLSRFKKKLYIEFFDEIQYDEPKGEVLA